MSSNAAWPGSFNADIVALWRGEETNLTPFRLSEATLSEADLAAITGNFVETRFGWEASIELDGDNLVMARNELRSPFAPTTDGEFHMPIYDWLCAYTDYGMAFTCRQRDPESTIRFNYERR